MMAVLARAAMPDAGATSGISCEDLSFVYRDGNAATQSVSLSVGYGELLCLLGPNGAGKTTLIRLLTGDLRPSGGRVFVAGMDPTEHPIAVKQHLGIIPQSAGLYTGLSAEQHLRHLGPLRGLRGARLDESIERALREAGLLELRARPVSRLSGGEQRRVMIALALLSVPPILVLDEPTVGLDPVARRGLWDVIREQRSEGRAILLTTHYLEEAEILADRVALLEGGRITHQGTLAELQARIGKAVKVSTIDEGTGRPLSHAYFDSLAAAHRHVVEQGLSSYTVGRVTLEDVYLRLTGHVIE